MSLLILLPIEADPVPKKRRAKKNLVSPHSFNDSKVVFSLLTEVVAVYMGFSVIYVWEMDLQKLISELLGGSGSWSNSKSRSASLSLKNNLKNPLQVIFGILMDINSNSRDNSNKRFCS